MKKLMLLVVLAALVSGASYGMDTNAPVSVVLNFKPKFWNQGIIDNARAELGNHVEACIAANGIVNDNELCKETTVLACVKSFTRPVVDGSGQPVKELDAIKVLKKCEKTGMQAYLKPRILSPDVQNTNAQGLKYYIAVLRGQETLHSNDMLAVKIALTTNKRNFNNTQKKQQNASWFSSFWKRCSFFTGFGTLVSGLYYYYSTYYAPQTPTPVDLGLVFKASAVSAALTLTGGTAAAVASLKTQYHEHQLNELAAERKKLACDLGVEVAVSNLPDLLGFDPATVKEEL